MEAENTICDYRCHWKVIKGVREVLPNIGIAVLSQALIIKPVAEVFSIRNGKKM